MKRYKISPLINLENSQSRTLSLIFKFCLLIAIFFSLTNCTSTTVKQSSFNKTRMTPSVGKIQKIALFLPLSGQYGSAGQAVRDGFMAAYYQAGSPKNINLAVYDTSNQPIKSLYAQATAKGTNLIVGPLDKNSLQELTALSPKTAMLALNYLLKNQPQLNNIIQFGLSPQNEAQQVAQKAYSRGARRIFMIYPSSNWGKGIAGAFIQTWQAMGGSIAAVLPYTPNMDMGKGITNAIGIVGTTPPRIKFDGIFLVANPTTARQMIPILQYHKLDQTIFSISQIYSGIADPIANKALDGIIFCDIPFVLDNTPTLLKFRGIFKATDANRFTRYMRLYALGIDTYYLSQHYLEISNNQSFRYQGYTGLLTIQNRSLVRHLNVATFSNGLAQRL